MFTPRDLIHADLEEVVETVRVELVGDHPLTDPSHLLPIDAQPPEIAVLSILAAK